MQAPRIVPMGPEHHDTAAMLLAQRQLRLRSARPELPADYRLHRHIDERLAHG